MTRALTAPAEARRAGREVERSLVIVDSDPESVFQRLARLRKLDGYALRAREPERIVDRYYDTPEGKLRKDRIALRLRTMDGEVTIGVKGPQRSASVRTEDRSERERPLTMDALDEVGRRLGLRGDPSADDVSPGVLLEQRLGVRLIQTRDTRRLVRDVLDVRQQSGPTLAELALDRVQFHVDGPPIRHYEVEVEAKRTGRGTDATRNVTEELLARYPDQLAEWPYGKLPTGRAIEELLRRRAFRELAGSGALTPKAYEKIRRRLDRAP